MQPEAVTIPTELPDPSLDHPLRPIWLAGALTMPLWALSVAITVAVAAPLTPRPVVEAVLGLASAVLVLGVAGIAVVLARPPVTRADAVRRRWHTQAIIACGHASCLGVIWLVMPRLDAETQFMVVVFLVAYVPALVIGSPESTTANRAGTVLVLGSTAVFLATQPSAHAHMMAAYIAVFGATLFVLSGTIRRTVDRAFWARRASDEHAAALARLAETVAAERDAKTRFIAAASHDLGQPLQAAALFFEQATRAADPAARARAADGARRAFEAADRLLSHMLNHLRLEADAVMPQTAAVRLPALLERVAARHGTGGMRIRVAGRRRSVMLDPVLTDRALGNLVHNAEVHSGGSRVLIAARAHGPGAIRLWVIDDGRGVGDRDAPRIFDDYYQGAPMAGSGRSGFGLGLSSVRRIARLMGGEAGLDRRWRHGCAFYVELPLVAAPATLEAVAGA